MQPYLGDLHYDIAGKQCLNQRRILFLDSARASTISSPERRSGFLHRTVHPSQPGGSYRPRDWSFVTDVIAEWHIPGPAGNQHLYSSPQSRRKHTLSRACIYPGTCEGELLDGRGSDCSRSHPSHILSVLLYPLLFPNPNEELYSRI